MASAVPVVEEAADYSFLPIIHDIIKCVGKDSPDVHQELNKLKTKILCMFDIHKPLKTQHSFSLSMLVCVTN